MRAFLRRTGRSPWPRAFSLRKATAGDGGTGPWAIGGFQGGRPPRASKVTQASDREALPDVRPWRLECPYLARLYRLRPKDDEDCYGPHRVREALRHGADRVTRRGRRRDHS